MYCCFSFSQNPLIPLRFQTQIIAKSSSIPPLHTRKRNQATKIYCTRLDKSSQNTSSTTQQVNLSVLRFTFGIPGLDESYLPRWIGYAFGSLLLLNHFVGSDLSAITAAQLRTEVLGLSLAAFSILIPYLGKFLKGATPINEKNVPEGTDQIFLMSPNMSDTLKEDLAWGTYVLLRNTNTVSVLVSVQDALCVRGYWNSPKDVSKDHLRNWFEKQIQQTDLLNLQETLYFPQAADSEVWEMLPKGTLSILVEPVQTEKSDGFILLASNNSYAYSNRDKAWIVAVANKFKRMSNVLHGQLN